MKYKEFELILSSFKCNKNCPYCTAKITRWPNVDDHLEKLEENLLYLKNKDISFRYFIFCGNGEPSLHSFETIQKIVNATRNVNIFEEKRFQSSGNIFFEKNKFELIKNDFTIEITRVNFDSQKDMAILGYDKDYMQTETFPQANIRLNYVLMKNKSFDESLREIKQYLDTYPNIQTVSLKTLNLNTKNGNIDNPYSKWILENALTKQDTDKIVDFMSKNAKSLIKDDTFFDRYEWIYNGKPVTFYTKKLKYGNANVVCYGGELVDYGLNKLNI